MNNNSLYTPPVSELQTAQELPENYLNSSLTASSFKVLAWLSILYLILSISLFGFATLIQIVETLKPYENLLSVISLLNIFLWSYLIIMFRKFLHLRFEFYKVDILINTLIILSILLGAVSFIPSNHEIVSGIKYRDVISVILMIPIGIVMFMIGKRLLKISDEFRYLKTLSWLNMIAGVLSATIVLILFAAVFGFVMDLFMALIFFEAAREKRQLQSA
jgi:hypothetical protein